MIVDPRQNWLHKTNGDDGFNFNSYSSELFIPKHYIACFKGPKLEEKMKM